MIERPDVDALLAGELGHWLRSQAAVRDEARENSNTRFLWAVLVLLPIVSFLWFTPISAPFKMFVSFGVAMAGGVWGYAPRAKAIKETKSGINQAIASALQINYSHDCEAGIGFQRARQHKMFDSFTRSKFEDLWHGDLGGLPFSMHEAHLERKQGSGKNSRWVTVFRGPVITIACNRDFHGVTLLERSGRHKKFLFFGEKDEVSLDGIKLAKADMVNPQFEDTFTVFGSDQVEARYLVHPVYIERLVALENAFSGKDIKALFKDQELTIVLSAENMFESGSMDSSQDRANVEMCVSQFMSMAQLSATLNGPER